MRARRAFSWSSALDFLHLQKLTRSLMHMRTYRHPRKGETRHMHSSCWVFLIYSLTFLVDLHGQWKYVKKMLFNCIISKIRDAFSFYVDRLKETGIQYLLLCVNSNWNYLFSACLMITLLFITTASICWLQWKKLYKMLVFVGSNLLCDWIFIH